MQGNRYFDPGASMTRRLVLCVLVTLALANCTAETNQTKADADATQRLLHGAPPDGFARLYFFDGRFINETSEGFFNAKFRADEIIDGIKVGGLNGHDILVVDVPAGKHELMWRERSSDAPTSKPITVALASGMRVFISNDWRMHQAASPLILFGAAGGALAGIISASQDDGSTGPIMTIRANGEEMSSGYIVVLPDPAAVAQLSRRM
jgi:hypothetical protein